MTAATTSRPDVDLSDAYMDLEPQIRLSRRNRRRKTRARDSTVRGLHVEQMVKDLEKAWDAGFRLGVQSKESASAA
jgi:hypothetical protein